MARTTRRPEPTARCTLLPLATTCPACGQPLSLDYYNERTVTTLDDVLRLRLGIRRCAVPLCQRNGKPVRPEAEGRIALPHHEFGLDVIATVGALRYQQPVVPPAVQRATQASSSAGREALGQGASLPLGRSLLRCSEAAALSL
jgi:hypothetical protein